MGELVELFLTGSINGRWGLALVGPEETPYPYEGELKHVGVAAGVDTYEFCPGKTNTWVLPVLNAVRVHGGATLVREMSMQGHDYASMLLLGERAVIELIGYKGRSSRIVVYIRGELHEVSAPVLATMGLVKAGGKLVAVEPPPPLNDVMMEAFAKAFANR